MKKINVSAVSYTNTLPFIYGIQHSPAILEQIELSLDVPSECANKLITGQADIGIVPVAGLLEIPDYQVISNYCLGASGAVNSVFIFSEKPIEEVKTLRLDPQSRTSNGLAQVLLHHYWERKVAWVSNGDADAYVEIGDRTFGKKDQYPYVYDLSLYWEKYTGLPFTFAVWAANRTLPESFIRSFNEALSYGLDHREAVIAQLAPRADFDYRSYLMKYIDYDFDAAKKEAMELYLKLLKSLQSASAA